MRAVLAWVDVEGVMWKLLVAAALAASVITGYRTLLRSSQRSELFEQSYRTVNARIVDSVAWALRHARRWRLDLAVLAGLMLLMTTALPVIGVVEPESVPLTGHGIAIAVGALAWGCVLEYVDIHARNPGVPFPGSLFKTAHVFVVLDALLALGVYVDHHLRLRNYFIGGLGGGQEHFLGFPYTAHHVNPSAWDAGLVGAAIVAFGDLVSVLAGVVMTVGGNNPLRDP